MRAHVLYLQRPCRIEITAAYDIEGAPNTVAAPSPALPRHRVASVSCRAGPSRLSSTPRYEFVLHGFLEANIATRNRAVQGIGETTMSADSREVGGRNRCLDICPDNTRRDCPALSRDAVTPPSFKSETDARLA